MPDIEPFKALLVDKRGDEMAAEVRRLGRDDLPEGDVVVQVGWSGINYKDALAVTGRGKIVRRFPMVPGIDLAGTVIESVAALYAPGDEVLVTGFGAGEDHWGGYTQLTRLKEEWLVPVPPALGARRSMALGTAGLTAMLSVMALEEHGVTPDRGSVAVTGAGGGVGGFAVALLARRGFEVDAVSGRPELEGYLTDLGAATLVARSELAQPADRPLASERWIGAVDSVGGTTLANLIRMTARQGSVAACGNVGGHELQTTVFPFILRGVSVLGIDSNYCPTSRRRVAWARLAAEMPVAMVDRIVQREAVLEDVPQLCDQVLAGAVRGRLLVDIGAR